MSLWSTVHGLWDAHSDGVHVARSRRNLASQDVFWRGHGEGAQLKVAFAVRCQQGVTASETKIRVAERGGS